MNEDGTFSEYDDSELIDTLWNVNVTMFLPSENQLNELIDTLWNVNIAKFVMIVTPVAELIDTLWNVNHSVYRSAERGQGINRYIMECK